MNYIKIIHILKNCTPHAIFRNVLRRCLLPTDSYATPSLAAKIQVAFLWPSKLPPSTPLSQFLPTPPPIPLCDTAASLAIKVNTQLQDSI